MSCNDSTTNALDARHDRRKWALGLMLDALLLAAIIATTIVPRPAQAQAQPATATLGEPVAFTPPSGAQQRAELQARYDAARPLALAGGARIGTLFGLKPSIFVQLADLQRQQALAKAKATAPLSNPLRAATAPAPNGSAR